MYMGKKDGEPHYVIDENENLEDMIAQLDKSGITLREES
jgi:hypothetical protein